MASNKTYEINSLEQIANIVDLETMSDLLMAFAQCLNYYVEMIHAYRTKFPDESKGKMNSELFAFSFAWTDDGNDEIMGYKFTNRSTGEYSIVNPKQQGNEPRN